MVTCRSPAPSAWFPILMCAPDICRISLILLPWRPITQPMSWGEAGVQPCPRPRPAPPSPTRALGPCSRRWEPRTPGSWFVRQDPVLGREEWVWLRAFPAPHGHGRGCWPLGTCPASCCWGCSPGTMLGEAKGTAWPESCWSLVTCAGGEGPRSRGGKGQRGQRSEGACFRKGCLGLGSLTSAGVTPPY